MTYASGYTHAGAEVRPRWWRLAAYGLLGLPLAMAALPVYVQVAALAALGYRPGIAGSGTLVLVYAAVPCLLKLLAMASLRRPWPAPSCAIRYRSSP